VTGVSGFAGTFAALVVSVSDQVPYPYLFLAQTHNLYTCPETIPSETYRMKMLYRLHQTR